mmetsp:Transcript_102275/g.288955  ORF Transcript_102275/g.288955 Transcript_102275/m.288955 type:complete len:218 (-) Transcript_102275:537-1190(-)
MIARPSCPCAGSRAPAAQVVLRTHHPRHGQPVPAGVLYWQCQCHVPGQWHRHHVSSRGRWPCRRLSRRLTQTPLRLRALPPFSHRSQLSIDGQFEQELSPSRCSWICFPPPPPPPPHSSGARRPPRRRRQNPLRRRRRWQPDDRLLQAPPAQAGRPAPGSHEVGWPASCTAPRRWMPPMARRQARHRDPKPMSAWRSHRRRAQPAPMEVLPCGPRSV